MDGYRVTYNDASQRNSGTIANSTTYYVVSASGGTSMQLSATSGGSAITPTANATITVAGPNNDWEGVYFQKCVAIGCGLAGLFAAGSDGTSNILTVDGCTFSVTGASATSYGIYSYGAGGPQFVNNNFESTITGGQTYDAIYHFYLSTLNGFGAFGAICNNVAFAAGGGTTQFAITGGISTTLIQTGNVVS